LRRLLFALRLTLHEKEGRGEIKQRGRGRERVRKRERKSEKEGKREGEVGRRRGSERERYEAS